MPPINFRESATHRPRMPLIGGAGKRQQGTSQMYLYIDCRAGLVPARFCIKTGRLVPAGSLYLKTGRACPYPVLYLKDGQGLSLPGFIQMGTGQAPALQNTISSNRSHLSDRFAIAISAITMPSPMAASAPPRQ